MIWLDKKLFQLWFFDKVIGPETWEPESDEEDDFPYRDFVATLGQRTLAGPYASRQQKQVSQKLVAPWTAAVWQLKPSKLDVLDPSLDSYDHYD